MSQFFYHWPFQGPNPLMPLYHRSMFLTFFSNIHPNVSFLGHFDPLFLFSSSHPLFLACLFPTLSRVWHAVVSQAPELDIAKETEVDFVPGG